jgi:hypothetical protein
LISSKQCAIAAAPLLALVVGLIAAQGPAQTPKLPFAAGEKLRYAVRWRLVPAGEAELVLGKEDAPQGRWKLTAKANSIGYVSNFYKVDDEYQSLFRNQSLCSSEIRKTIHEGERHRLLTLIFDQRRHLALFTDRETTGNAPPARQAQSAIPDCVQDILSAIYFVRTRPLTMGQPIDIPLNDGARTVNLRVDVQAKEEIKTAAGTFQTTRVEPELFSGNLFKGKGRMFVWFSDDASHVPVQLRAQIGIGTITASLTAVERPEANP